MKAADLSRAVEKSLSGFMGHEKTVIYYSLTGECFNRFPTQIRTGDSVWWISFSETREHNTNEKVTLNIVTYRRYAVIEDDL